MGLFVMRERVALIDGRLEVQSRPGKGTTVRAVVPLAALDARGAES
jgi:signal transduction histidine kinase